MTKIDELIKSICNKGGPYHPDWYSEGDIENIMKEYAEWYAKECLQIAAQQATTMYYIPVEDGCMMHTHAYDIVDPNSILNITFPEHE